MNHHPPAIPRKYNGYKRSHDNIKGFTLIELSIVLVIIGVLAGGILVGRTLIKAAETRAVITEYQRIETSILTFRGKYSVLPGDMNNATSIWGTATTCPGDFGHPSTDLTTCDGDGNGQILTNQTNFDEVWRLWQHLAAARLIEGKYTGVAAAGGELFGEAGLNAPYSRINSATWAVYYNGPTSNGTTNRFAGRYGNTVSFGKDSYANDPVITGQQAFQIDSKIDDGKPGMGKVIAFKNAHRPYCTTVGTEITASYFLDTNVVGCNLFFITDF